MDRPDLLYSVQELTRKMASPRAEDLIAPKKSSPLHNTLSTNGLQDICGLHWTVTLKSMATRILLDVLLRESPQMVES